MERLRRTGWRVVLGRWPLERKRQREAIGGGGVRAGDSERASVHQRAAFASGRKVHAEAYPVIGAANARHVQGNDNLARAFAPQRVPPWYARLETVKHVYGVSDSRPTSGTGGSASVHPGRGVARKSRTRSGGSIVMASAVRA